MRIAIVGPGALGCLLATFLHRGLASADSFCLVDHNSYRAEQIGSDGLLCEEEQGDTRIPVTTHFTPRDMEPVDVLLFCVKSYDVRKTIDFCAPLLRFRPLPVFLQNGIGHLRHRHSLDGIQPVFATTTEGATGLGPGHIRHAGRGETFLGFLDSPEDSHRQLLENLRLRLQAGGMLAHTTERVLERIWAKLFINVGINALTVIHDCPNGRLLEIGEAKMMMERAIEEAGRVAACENITVSDPLRTTRDVCRKTAANISSMLQDVRRKRRTEIDAINGAIVALAEKHDIAVPVNRELVNTVKEIEARYE